MHRFYSEMTSGTKIGDPLTMATPHQFADQLPKGSFDVIDGYYEPKSKCIYKWESNELLREVEEDEIDWIKANCRVGTE